MKILFFFIFFLSIGQVFATEGEIPDLTSYKGYLNNVRNFCSDTSQPWGNWKTNSLIVPEQVTYANIDKKEEGDQQYKDYLRSINANPSKISILGIGTGPAFLEKASYVYKETMGSIYVCAVMNAKIRIIDTLLTKIPSTQSNLKNKLRNQGAFLRNNITKNNCRELTDIGEMSIKKSLLDNTTYQYCNYRQYLYYLNNASKQELDIYYSGSSSNRSSPLDNTEAVAKKIAQSANKITKEIAHTKEIFPQAMVAFTEFEKTYASHILLEFILQDYIDLRESLKKLINPIGQVIYEASNAQSPGK